VGGEGWKEKHCGREKRQESCGWERTRGEAKGEEGFSSVDGEGEFRGGFSQVTPQRKRVFPGRGVLAFGRKSESLTTGAEER